MEYDLDTNGGLMPQILALTAPPGSRERTDNGDGSTNLSAHPYFKRPGRGHNRDCCDSCGEGGDLICCDICPASFHLVCHDPPLDEETIPQGEWGCHQCKANDILGTAPSTSNKFSNKSAKRKDREEEKGSKALSLSSKMSRLECSKSKLIVSGRPVEADRSVFAPLIIDAASRNPKEFSLPYSMNVPIAFPGESKNTHRNGKRIVNSRKKKCELDSGGLVSLPARLCYTCNRSCRAGSLLACDYCSLLFHLDCLDPPLTTAPSGKWLCPNHPQHFMEDKVLLTASVSDRVKLWEKCTGTVDEVSILRTLLNKIHRPRPLVRHRTKLALRDRIKVPSAIKHAYSNPSTMMPALPPPHLRPPTTTFTSSSLHPKLNFTKSSKVVDKSESEDTSSNSTRSSSVENEQMNTP